MKLLVKFASISLLLISFLIIQGFLEIDMGTVIFILLGISAVIFSIYAIRKDFKKASRLKKFLLILLLLVSLLFFVPSLFLIISMLGFL